MRILADSALVGNTWAALPPEILQRLAAEAIHSPGDWHRLSRTRRRSIFGITPSMVRTLDAAAIGESP